VNQQHPFPSPVDCSLKMPLDEHDWNLFASSKCRTSWSKGPDAISSVSPLLQAIASYLSKENSQGQNLSIIPDCESQDSTRLQLDAVAY
jgi:hypothetical protein